MFLQGVKSFRLSSVVKVPPQKVDFASNLQSLREIAICKRTDYEQAIVIRSSVINERHSCLCSKLS